MSVSDWILKLPWDIISSTAFDYKLDRKFVGALVHVESDGIASMTRFEPLYKYLYFPERYAENLMITQITEEVAQRTSYGLTQIMGGVARELGYSEHLSRLCEPKLGLEFGCRKLNELKITYGGDLEHMASAYNHGSATKLDSGMFFNQKYVDDLFRFYREIS